MNLYYVIDAARSGDPLVFRTEDEADAYCNGHPSAARIPTANVSPALVRADRANLEA